VTPFTVSGAADGWSLFVPRTTGSAFSELVLTGLVRVVTHPAVFNPPSTLAQALAFANME
jgi:hypothetical protein